MAYQPFEPQEKNIDPDKLLDPDKSDAAKAANAEENEPKAAAGINAKPGIMKGKPGSASKEPFIKPGALKPPGPQRDRPKTVADYKKVTELVSQMRRLAATEPDTKKLILK